MLNNIGSGEIIIIAIVLMLFFGGDKLPELARGIRKATTEFRNAVNEPDPTKKKVKKRHK